ncbi:MULTISPECIES: DUF4268 domain-containing protein [unclassified Vibrio]|uniref:DUF4268 domain-containing protein n=1 Tax=Vibrio sp. HB236076 TaxID=3232307 RepID=A0AB39HEN6_9VIBR|nr:DUF4268 domain-containing protein [Vibrio sp. HB161653]MDP5253013.1 DUF4268 domain-containing protein [Vibrio sp. HB161653]
MQFEMTRFDAEENKRLFDYLYDRIEDIHAQFGQELEWLRLDEKKASRVQCARPINGDDRQQWPEVITWYVENMSRLESALKDVIQDAKKVL